MCMLLILWMNTGLLILIWMDSLASLTTCMPFPVYQSEMRNGAVIWLTMNINCSRCMAIVLLYFLGIYWIHQCSPDYNSPQNRTICGLHFVQDDNGALSLGCIRIDLRVSLPLRINCTVVWWKIFLNSSLRPATYGTEINTLIRKAKLTPVYTTVKPDKIKIWSMVKLS